MAVQLPIAPHSLTATVESHKESVRQYGAGVGVGVGVGGTGVGVGVTSIFAQAGYVGDGGGTTGITTRRAGEGTISHSHGCV